MCTPVWKSGSPLSGEMMSSAGTDFYIDGVRTVSHSHEASSFFSFLSCVVIAFPLRWFHCTSHHLSLECSIMSHIFAWYLRVEMSSVCLRVFCAHASLSFKEMIGIPTKHFVFEKENHDTPFYLHLVFAWCLQSERFSVCLHAYHYDRLLEFSQSTLSLLDMLFLGHDSHRRHQRSTTIRRVLCSPNRQGASGELSLMHCWSRKLFES